MNWDLSKISTVSDMLVNTINIGLGGSNIDTNTSLGQNALLNNTSGFQNTAVGCNVLGSYSGLPGTGSSITLITGTNNPALNNITVAYGSAMTLTLPLVFTGGGGSGAVAYSTYLRQGENGTQWFRSGTAITNGGLGYAVAPVATCALPIPPTYPAGFTWSGPDPTFSVTLSPPGSVPTAETGVGFNALISNLKGQNDTAVGKNALATETGYAFSQEVSGITWGNAGLYTTNISTQLNPFPLVFTGGGLGLGGTPATGYVNVIFVPFVNKAITNPLYFQIVIDNPGSGYTSTPSVTVTVPSSVTALTPAFGGGDLSISTTEFYGHNTAVGSGALATQNHCEYNTAIGFSAGSSLTSGSFNTAIGYNAQLTTTSVSHEIMVGTNLETVIFPSLAVLGTGDYPPTYDQQFVTKQFVDSRAPASIYINSSSFSLSSWSFDLGTIFASNATDALDREWGYTFSWYMYPSESTAPPPDNTDIYSNYTVFKTDGVTQYSTPIPLNDWGATHIYNTNGSLQVTTQSEIFNAYGTSTFGLNRWTTSNPAEVIQQTLSYAFNIINVLPVNSLLTATTTTTTPTWSGSYPTPTITTNATTSVVFTTTPTFTYPYNVQMTLVIVPNFVPQ